MTKNLKPCPFCGGKDLYVDAGEYRTEYEIRCVKCGGRVSYFDTYQQAANAWNRRVHSESEND